MVNGNAQLIQHNGNTDNFQVIYGEPLNNNIPNPLKKYTVPRGGGIIEPYKVIQEVESPKIEKECALTAAQQNAFDKSFKTGIYKQLHKKGLLTDAQLNMVLKLQI